MKVNLKAVSQGFGKIVKSKHFKDFIKIEAIMSIGAIIGYKNGKVIERINIQDELLDPEKNFEADFLTNPRDKKNYPILDNKLKYNPELKAYEIIMNQPEAWPKDEET